MIVNLVAKPTIRALPPICLVLILALAIAPSLWAAPIAPWQAEGAVMAWLVADGNPLGASMGRQVADVQAYPGADGAVDYYVVSLSPGGFAVVTADDQVEPILAFSPDGEFDPSSASPLGALVSGDVAARIESVDNALAISGETPQAGSSAAELKWRRLLGIHIAGITWPPSDERVAPLLQSKWSQDTVGGRACYNYFTPPGVAGSDANYPCGCVATAMAQMMRYHQYPASGIGVKTFQIKIDGVTWSRATRGGNGLGGPYDYASMALEPRSSTTDAQRRAIGALCYDAGIASLTSYRSEGSSASFTDAQTAFVSTFLYSNVVFGYNSGSNIGAGLIGMINPNLDAGQPVMLALGGAAEGHAVVCDGYGYDLSTAYHHLNMGWSGQGDIWYNLPTIQTSYGDYSTVEQCLYNICETGKGEIISGRVLTSGGQPIDGATVAGIRQGITTLTAASRARGVYALQGALSNSGYTVIPWAPGYVFSPRTTSTGISNSYASHSGNVQGIDFTAQSGWEGPSDPSSAIPDADAAGVESTFYVTDAGLISDLDVSVTILHARDSDLTAYLISPDGTSVTLFSGVGGTGDDMLNTILDDEAATLITAGSAPFAGNYRPTGSLSAFDGKAMRGTWKLRVVDSSAGTSGTLASWSLRPTLVVDAVSPTCVVTGPASPTSVSPVAFAIAFSEPVTGLTASEITVTGGTRGLLSGSGASYTLPVTPSGYGTVTCQVPAGAANDVSANPNVASNVASVAYQESPPAVTLVSPTSATTFGRTCANVSLAGTSSDADGIASVAWSNDRGGSSTCTGTTSWTAVVTLQSGRNTITITATDGVGNTGDFVLTVDRTTADPGGAWTGLAMVSLPLEPDATDPKTVVGFDGNTWLAYQPNPGEYVAYPDAWTQFSLASPTPGRGFWARFPQAGPTVSLCGTMPRQDQPYTIHLQTGWNLIGNPFASAVPWSVSAIKVQQAGYAAVSLASASSLVACYAWGWDNVQGEYYLVCDPTVASGTVTSIQPWRGYWIKAKATCDLIIPAP